MNLLGEVSKIIARLDKEEDIILAILTVITARQGLGFNRAFVFLRGSEFNIIRGKYALGPSSPDEATSIWKILEKDATVSLDKLVSKGQKLHYLRSSPLTKITRKLELPMNDPDSLLVKSMQEVRFVKKSDLRSESDLMVADALGLEEFCTCPIATVEDSLGLLIVDNIFTGAQISTEDAQLLEMIVSHATTSLRAAQLKESLNKNIESLKSTYRKLRANEERMMKAERLAISGELTSSVLHEIKNPLVSIGGFARNLINSESITGKDREKLEIIVNETMRLERYLDALQSEVDQLNLEIGDINQILEDNCNLISEDLRERNIVLQKSFAPNVARCAFDVVKIHEVFLNILQNGIEAIGSDGLLRVETSQEDSIVIVEICDDGNGIPQEHINRIFTPFFTTKADGSGLGLAFAHRIIQDHGGSISVSSSEGEGTTFKITLPVAAAMSAI
jgi:signal transduction histidine kinase